MIKYDVQRLYDATNGGLKIIADFCPEAAEACAKETQKLHFAFNVENTPSAHLFKAENNWIIKDFSNGAELSKSGKTGNYDPIAVYCKAEGKDRTSDFPRIMEYLYARYGLSGEEAITDDKNKPIIDDPVTAPDDMEEGEYRWSDLRPLNAAERKVMGKFVTEAVAKELKWYAVDFVGMRKDGKVRWKHSNENYPIFCRECCVYNEAGTHTGTFFKFYEPLNPKKNFRFYVADKDRVKPQQYINNIGEYNKAFDKFRLEKEVNRDASNKLLEQGVVICCGERDALACRALGWWPIWLNSETAEFPNSLVRMIRRVNTHCPIYYIPDLDPTGQAMMNKLANAHPDFWIVELPPELKERKDNRGKPMKDLRDWVESEREMDSWTFNKFMETAHRVQFWEEIVTKNGEKKIKLDTDCLHFFLRTNGIEPIYDEDVKIVEFGRHINEYMIESMDMKKVNDFVMKWARKQLLSRAVKNALTDGAKLDQSKLEKMLSSSYNFTNHDESKQIMYFSDRMVVIKESGIELYEPKKASESDVRVWSQSVINRPFRFITREETIELTDKWGRKQYDAEGKVRKVRTMVRTKLFHYTRTIDETTGLPDLSIDINEEAYNSPAFCVLCATSHIYWQDEQTVLEAQGKSKEEIREYWKQNWCRLDSPLLTESKIYEQKASLISKLFIIGYYGWDYNKPANPWAAYIMDDFDGEGSNGGSGKSLTFSYIRQYKEFEVLDGRRKENNRDKFIFASVTSRTKGVLFDDFMGNFSDWYQAMSDGLRIERKGGDAFTLAHEKSPKLAFTTNGVGDKQSSSIRRQIRTTCSSFFHSEGNGFSESSTPADYCGDLWGSSYTPEKWRYDDNIFLECIEEAMPYIKANIKIEPPLERAQLRKLRREIGKANIEFFDDYFAPGELSHANKFITRENYVADYQRSLAGKGNFTTELVLLEKTAMWAAYRSWVIGYCPEGVPGWAGDLKGEYRHSRIIQVWENRSVEGIYIATIENEDPALQYLKHDIEMEAIKRFSEGENADKPI